MKLCSVEGCTSPVRTMSLCHKHYGALQYQRTKEKAKAAARARYAANHEAIRARQKEYLEANRELARERDRKRYAANVEKMREDRRRYRINNPDKISAANHAAVVALTDSYVRKSSHLPRDAPQQIIETYRLIQQLRREAKS